MKIERGYWNPNHNLRLIQLMSGQAWHTESELVVGMGEETRKPRTW